MTYVLHFCSGDHKEQEELLVLEELQRISRQSNQVNAVILFVIMHDFNSFLQVQIKIFASFVEFLDVKIAVSSVACVLTEVN